MNEITRVNAQGQEEFVPVVIPVEAYSSAD